MLVEKEGSRIRVCVVPQTRLREGRWRRQKCQRLPHGMVVKKEASLDVLVMLVIVDADLRALRSTRISTSPLKKTWKDEVLSALFKMNSRRVAYNDIATSTKGETTVPPTVFS